MLYDRVPSKEKLVACFKSMQPAFTDEAAPHNERYRAKYRVIRPIRWADWVSGITLMTATPVDTADYQPSLMLIGAIGGVTWQNKIKLKIWIVANCWHYQHGLQRFKEFERGDYSGVTYFRYYFCERSAS